MRIRGIVARVVAIACIGWAGPSAAWADALRYGDHFESVEDVATADVQVSIRFDAQGAIAESRVQRSTRPEADAALLAELTRWRFPRAQPEGGKKAKAIEAGFRFTGSPPPSSPGAPLRRSSGIEIDREAEGAPPAMPNEIWFGWPKDYRGALDEDVAIPVAGIVGPTGELIAVRVEDERHPVLDDYLRDATWQWRHAQFEPVRRADGALDPRVQMLARFLVPPKTTRDFETAVRYPKSLAGLSGMVTLKTRIQRDGTVRDLRIEGAAHPSYEAAVTEALRKGPPFEPAQYRGAPIPTFSELRIAFKTDGVQPREPYRFTGSKSAPETWPAEFRYDEQPKVTLAVDAVYPYELAARGITGSATVSLLVDPQGEVASVEVTQASEPAFGLALKAAMEAWRFEPARLKGSPVWSTFTRRVEFALSAFDADALNASARRLMRRAREGDGIPEAATLDGALVPLARAVPVFPPDRDPVAGEERITVEFFVDKDGNAQMPRALDHRDASLAWSAATAVSRWRFEVPRRGGKPADALARVNILFKPPPPVEREARAEIAPAAEGAAP